MTKRSELKQRSRRIREPLRRMRLGQKFLEEVLQELMLDVEALYDYILHPDEPPEPERPEAQPTRLKEDFIEYQGWIYDLPSRDRLGAIQGKANTPETAHCYEQPGDDPPRDTAAPNEESRERCYDDLQFSLLYRRPDYGDASKYIKVTRKLKHEGGESRTASPAVAAPDGDAARVHKSFVILGKLHDALGDALIELCRGSDESWGDWRDTTQEDSP